LRPCSRVVCNKERKGKQIRNWLVLDINTLIPT
jgi:hypothetical protein